MKSRIASKIANRMLVIDALIVLGVHIAAWDDVAVLRMDIQYLKRRWPRIYDRTFGRVFRGRRHFQIRSRAH